MNCMKGNNFLCQLVSDESMYVEIETKLINNFDSYPLALILFCFHCCLQIKGLFLEKSILWISHCTQLKYRRMFSTHKKHFLKKIQNQQQSKMRNLKTFANPLKRDKYKICAFPIVAKIPS